MRAHWKHFVYLMKHKWFVLVECVKLGIAWRGLVHDLSKFSPAEWGAYTRFFFVEKNDENRKAFDRAWLHHMRVNDHHWQAWIEPKADGNTVYPMPDACRREMLADWRGAGRAQGKGDDVQEWYEMNREKMVLHDKTREWIEKMIYGGSEV